MSKKKKVLEKLFQDFQKSGNPVFDNATVHKISQKVGVKNYFDVTKIDRSSSLPQNMLDADYYVVHLGKEGNQTYHEFIQGIATGFHKFEEISNPDEWEWKYRRSVLNERDTSESNILSVGFNQRIIHDFLYEDIVANPKVYNARRTKKRIQYSIGSKEVKTGLLQMEIDMTCELGGRVTIFEGKQGSPEDFAVYQLFHPHVYFEHEKASIAQNADGPQITKTDYCYLLKDKDAKTGQTLVSMYLYEFKELDPGSIRLIKNARYRLIER